jgi:hypothetical protein
MRAAGPQSRGSPHGRSGVAEQPQPQTGRAGASGQRIDWRMLPSLTANDQGDRSQSVGIAASFALKSIAAPECPGRRAASPCDVPTCRRSRCVEIDCNCSIATAGCARFEFPSVGGSHWAGFGIDPGDCQLAQPCAGVRRGGSGATTMAPANVRTAMASLLYSDPSIIFISLGASIVRNPLTIPLCGLAG